MTRAILDPRGSSVLRSREERPARVVRAPGRRAPRFVAPAPGTEHDHAVGRCVHRVEEQIHEPLLQLVRTAKNWRQLGRGVERGARAAEGPLRLQQLEARPQHHAERYGLQRLLVRTSVLEQAPHDAVDALELAAQAHHHLGVRAAAA